MPPLRPQRLLFSASALIIFFLFLKRCLRLYFTVRNVRANIEYEFGTLPIHGVSLHSPIPSFQLRISANSFPCHTYKNTRLKVYRSISERRQDVFPSFHTLTTQLPPPKMFPLVTTHV